MRVLVTGGTGYVGSHLVVALRREGHEVRLLVRRPEQVAETFAPYGLAFMRGWFPIWSKGGVHATDVRDAADVVAAVMEPGQGPRRYVVPGIHMTGKDLYGAVAKAIGRRRPHVDVPARMGLLSSQVVDLVQARLPARFHYPADSEGAEMAVRDTHLDDAPARPTSGSRRSRSSGPCATRSPGRSTPGTCRQGIAPASPKPVELRLRDHRVAPLGPPSCASETCCRAVTRTLGGSEITRNGSDDDPAYVIEQDAGAQVLKLRSEVEPA